MYIVLSIIYVIYVFRRLQTKTSLLQILFAFLKKVKYMLYFSSLYGDYNSKGNFVETPRQFRIYNFAIIKLRGVCTKLYFNLIFTMQTYKELINPVLVFVQ